MSVVGSGETTSDHADHQTTAPLIALVAGALLAMGQPVLATRVGLLAWNGCGCADQAAWWSSQLVGVGWFAATSVVLATAPGLFRRFRKLSDTLVTPAAAAFGAALAVPLTAAGAAWAAMYGGASLGWEAGTQAAAGTLTGLVVAIAGTRWPGLTSGVRTHAVMIWGIALLSVRLSPEEPPPLGHLIVGNGVNGGIATAILLTVPFLTGGAISIRLPAGTSAFTVAFAAASGPALLLFSYAVAFGISGYGWNWALLYPVVLAVPAAVAGGWLTYAFCRSPERHLLAPAGF